MGELCTENNDTSLYLENFELSLWLEMEEL